MSELHTTDSKKSKLAKKEKLTHLHVKTDNGVMDIYDSGLVEIHDAGLMFEQEVRSRRGIRKLLYKFGVEINPELSSKITMFQFQTN